MRYRFEDRFNIHIYCFDDLPQLKDAIRSIPTDIKVYVFDGRYEDFDGDYDLTPGAEDWCGMRENVIYHSPHASMLPFGKYGPSEHRYSQHEKGCWANYLILPPDQWTLQMDTDERLIRLDRDLFDNLKDEFRYRPTVFIDDGRTVTEPRIWKPKYWTLWIDDAAIPREFVDRDTSLEELKPKMMEHRSKSMEHISDDLIFIQNFGSSRPDDYNERRVSQLKKINRKHRAGKLSDSMKSGEIAEFRGR